MKESFADIVNEALAAQGLSVNAAARLAGIGTSTFQTYVRDKRPAHPTIPKAAKICDALGLEFRIGPPPLPESFAPRPPARLSGSIVAYPVEAAEITGAASPSGCMLFTATFLRQFGLDPTRLLAIEIEDDDMAPLLVSGGCAVADTREREIEEGSIYAIDDGKWPPLLRRAGRADGSGWLMRRDKPRADEEPWPDKSATLGKVIWASRMDFRFEWLDPDA